MNKRFDPVSGNIVSVFFYYAVPSVFGMIMTACAAVIDGYFLGRYAGPIALASVNLTVPLTGLLFGLAMMLSVGGGARCGKYLGAGKIKEAGGVFTQTLMSTAGIALLASAAGVLCSEELALLLGANQALAETVAEYLAILMLFNFFPMAVVCLACFLRLDNRPYLAAGAMAAAGLLNGLLDWLFVAQLHLGHQGAALGTGLSEMAAFLILAAPFLMKKTRLRFNWRQKEFAGVFKAAWNGFSELSNEISAGVLIFILNWVIMLELGEKGVAAFSVVNYVILFGFLTSCGISDSLPPFVSRNFGARKPLRIRSFLIISSTAVLVTGLLISLALILSPGAIIGLFMTEAEEETINLSARFLSRIWPIFILSGINMVLSSYLTAMHRALHSTVIALSRGLVLPLLFLAVIRTLTDYQGILIVLPLSELATACIALYLLAGNGPARLIAARKHPLHGNPAAATA